MCRACSHRRELVDFITPCFLEQRISGVKWCSGCGELHDIGSFSRKYSVGYQKLYCQKFAAVHHLPESIEWTFDVQHDSRWIHAVPLELKELYVSVYARELGFAPNKDFPGPPHSCQRASPSVWDGGVMSATERHINGVRCGE